MPQRLLLEGADIDELLARVQAEHGPHARIVHAEQRLVGGIAGFFARRRYELSVQVDDDLGVPASGPGPVASPGQPASMAALLEQADRADAAVVSSGRPAPAPSAPAPSAPTPSALAPSVAAPTGRRLSTQSPEFEQLLTDLVARSERSVEPVPVPRVAGAAGVAGAADATGTAAPDRARRALVRLGLPEALLPAHPVADPRTALLDVLAGVVGSVDDRWWGTTVVVGTPELAARTVELLLARTGCTATDVLVATSDAAGAAELAVQASAVCSVRGAAVVVIETASTRAAARRAGRLAAGLGLGTLVVALDAVRDASAQGEWLAALAEGGRRATWAAAYDVAEAPAPLALLGLGPTVGWLDDRVASVGAWAAPCLDRMQERGQA